MRLVFLGPPGAGKGTQAKILEQRFGFRQISTGDILRENRSAGTELGKLADGYMRRGELVPDDVIVGMIEAELDRYSAGFIMDGFPRTAAQARALDALLARKGLAVDAAVHFRVDRPSIVARLSARWTNPRNGRVYNTITNPPKVDRIDDEDGGPLIQREDDLPQTVEKRIDVYEKQTAPLIDYYRNAGKLVEVDGLGAVDDVTRQILAKLDVQKAAS